MLNREQLHTNPEAQPAEVVSQYQEVLKHIIGSHEQSMGSIVQSYDRDADKLHAANDPSAKQIDGLVQQPGGLVTTLTGDTTKDLEAAVELAAERCPKVLSSEDELYLGAAQAKTRGVDLSMSFWQVEQLLNSASSREARSTMRAALDNDIWKATQAKAQQVDLGTNYWQVNAIVRHPWTSQGLSE